MAFAKPKTTAARARLFVGMPLFHRGKANKVANDFNSFDPENGGEIFANPFLMM